MTPRSLKPRVLVVDDEPQILKSIQALLEDDFDVVVSSDATEAVEFLKNTQIAVILADQRMPNLTGGEFLAKAREICDATRILITGYVDIDALIRAVNDGQIHSYVPKPWEPANLKVTVLKAATFANEVTQRKKAAEIVADQQKALARSEDAYRQQTKILRSVLDSMSDGVMVTDDGGKMVLLNPAAEQMVVPGARSEALMRCALPMTNVTAMVSPSARPRPSMMPPTMPTREYGTTTCQMTSHVVVPRL